ncbi:unnamed protein product [Oncorhynchus mykiss]|uniref:Uncharacterized protein n=1 Tax=Oncorhynchus mykiss TaxID=8022 RepID=A0A060Y1P4_ONCMY|nr:unnamed protein product [Oncorhynchus mykiss]
MCNSVLLFLWINCLITAIQKHKKFHKGAPDNEEECYSETESEDEGSSPSPRRNKIYTTHTFTLSLSHSLSLSLLVWITSVSVLSYCDDCVIIYYIIVSYLLPHLPGHHCTG